MKPITQAIIGVGAMTFSMVLLIVTIFNQRDQLAVAHDQLTQVWTNTVSYRTGYADGWVALYIDTSTIEQFQRMEDAKFDGKHLVSGKELDDLWAALRQQAAGSQARWDALLPDAKTNYQPVVLGPYWRREARPPTGPPAAVTVTTNK